MYKSIKNKKNYIFFYKDKKIKLYIIYKNVQKEKKYHKLIK